MSEPVHTLEPETDSDRTGLRPSRRRRRWIAATVLFLVLLIVVPPFININQFRRTIVHSISAGLGRPVEASRVELQLFPRPGFVLYNLRVGEDPAYGAEPVMMAEKVTAGLRASTLWHGQVEIATLTFDAPSVNLVRNADGHWNFESLLRNSPALHAHARPARRSRRLPFPYVEASEARINFKQGAEKLPFSLERANLALWKDSAHVWRVRIRANPVRTDLTVEDAGQIRGEGRLTTGGPLMDAPVRGSLEWRRVELGEISRLLHGEDDGWRGTVDWTAEARGTLADVAVTSDVAVEGFRRAEFMPPTEMDVSAHCQGRYARYDGALNSLACAAPADDGQVWLRGFAALQAGRSGGGTRLPEQRPGPRVQIALQKVPAEFFFELLGHIHPGVSADTSASGEVNGVVDCAWRGLHMPAGCSGEIRAPEVRLHLAHLDHPLAMAPMQLESSRTPEAAVFSPTVWTLSPVHFSLGGTTPATLTGTVKGAGATLAVNGAADLAELSRLAQSLRIPAISGEVQSVRGSAQLNLALAMSWIAGPNGAVAPGVPSSSLLPGQVPSRWRGSVQLHNATLKMTLLPAAVELASGQIDLIPSGVEWSGLHGSFAHIPFDGSVAWQTPCVSASSGCARSFTLHTTDLSTERLQAALHHNADASGLLDLINPWAGRAPSLPPVSGILRADVLSAGPLSVKNAVLELRLKGHGAELRSLSGKMFGGTVSGVAGEDGAGSVRWGDGPPVYGLHVQLEHIQPDRVGALWQERWGGGVADAQVTLQTEGWSAAELARNASGTFAVDWTHRTLLSVNESSDRPVLGEFRRWQGNGSIRDRALRLQSSRMVPATAVRRVGLVEPVAQSVTGTVTFGRVLNLRLEPSGISITGVLGLPVVQAP